MRANRKWALLAMSCLGVLAGCGGGGEAGPCGSYLQTFGVDFPVRSISLKKGQEAKLASTVSPESCRHDMRFSVKDGKLPAGMSLVAGNLVGTPNELGTYVFQVSVEAVDGYDPVKPPPLSGHVTVNVVTQTLNGSDGPPSAD